MSNSRFKLEQVNLGDIVFVDKNANFMEQTTFNQLVENIKRDGELSTVPFTIKYTKGKKKGKYEVISGNHRVKAASMAGLSQIWVMYALETEISNDEKRAIQLSHNSIHGQDDLEILKELVDEIVNTDYKAYAHIDESDFEELNSYDYDVIQPTNEVVTITFTFFETNKKAFDTLVEELDMYTPEQLENIQLLPKEKLSEFNEIVGKIQDRYKVKSYGLGVLKMAELVKGIVGEFKTKEDEQDN